MLQHLETSTTIIFMSLFITLAWSVVSFEIICRSKVEHASPSRYTPVLPALVLGPIALIFFFKSFKTNLIFPIHLFASFSDILKSSIVPTIVLLIASGTVFCIYSHLKNSYARWSQMPFTTTARSIGLAPKTVLRRLVLIEGWVGGWVQCAPWFFGELIIIEVVFNAPGIGLEMWHLAKTRQIAELAIASLALIAIYGIFVFFLLKLNSWIGRKLDGYS